MFSKLYVSIKVTPSNFVNQIHYPKSENQQNQAGIVYVKRAV